MVPGVVTTRKWVLCHGCTFAITILRGRLTELGAHRMKARIFSFFLTHCAHRSRDDLADMASTTINRVRFDFVFF